MNAAVFFRWNWLGDVTPSARRTARVSALPIRRSGPGGRRSCGMHTSIIGIAVFGDVVDRAEDLCRVVVEQPVILAKRPAADVPMDTLRLHLVKTEAVRFLV